MEKDNYSLNILTGEKYLIPKEGDKENIDNFLSNHKGKKVIVVQGLGFVGAVMSLVCANALHEDYAVVGVDLLSKYLKHFVLTDKLNTKNWVKGFRHHDPRSRVA